jgi:hypothetical protein
MNETGMELKPTSLSYVFEKRDLEISFQY